MELRNFQKKFIREALRPGVKIAALSLPRGNGKSTLAAHLVSRALTPGDDLFRPGAESILCAGSVKQARIVFRIARDMLGADDPDYSYLDSTVSVGIRHKATNTRLTVMSSSGHTAMGLVNCPLAIADEPAAWPVNEGQVLWSALTTAANKPESPLKIVVTGTLSPRGTIGHWWANLIHDGCQPGTYVQSLIADPKKWRDGRELRRVNPLIRDYPDSMAGLYEERAKAMKDTSLEAQFKAYRMNIPSRDEAESILPAGSWELALKRELAARGRRAPVVGLDLGGSRSWSAAVAIWGNGRCEAVAVAPGLPSISKQEQRDRVSQGTYRRMYDEGQLKMAAGTREPPPSHLVEAILENWGRPAVAICDRFKFNVLRDSCDWKLIPRVSRWSDSTEDIQAIRAMAADGPLSIEPGSAGMLTHSLSVAQVKNDDSGNTRMVKADPARQTARDDICAALILAAGHWTRVKRKRPGGGLRTGTLDYWAAKGERKAS